MARDIGGSDPERMAPPGVQKYVEDLFKASSVSVEVMSDETELTTNYPLLAAVNRACRSKSNSSPTAYLSHLLTYLTYLFTYLPAYSPHLHTSQQYLQMSNVTRGASYG